MLRNYFHRIDQLFPENFQDAVELPLFYRARIVIASTVACIIAGIFLILEMIILKLSPVVIGGVALCVLCLISRLYFFKKAKSDFHKNLLTGALLQIFVLTVFLYLTAFSEKGLGFFGLIWLIHLFLLTAFYFKKLISLYFAGFQILLFFLVTKFRFEHFYNPIQRLDNFDKIFYVMLAMVIVFCFSLSFLFVHLAEELQVEIIKHKDLLVESAKFQSLGRMASNLAHDINNPLFTIQGKLHQMRNLLSRDQLDLEKCDQIVESVELTIMKMSQIVKGISTFAREGRGDQMIAVGIRELIESNLALAIDRIKNAGIELELDLCYHEKIICYPSFISQVLLNLLNNAIDALENVTHKKISVRAFKNGSMVHIQVVDNGLGINSEVEAKMFEPFFTTKTFGKGTGLGLSISKGLVEVHGGELKFHREKDSTIFEVLLPSYE